MADPNADTLMRRKIGAGRPAPGSDAADPPALWRRAVSRGLHGAIGMQARLTAFEQADLSPGDLLRLPGASDLVALLEGAGGGFGLAILDPALLASMVEMQTAGRVAPRPAPERVPTDTDAAMVADPLDRVLALLEAGGEDGADPVRGLRYATRVQRPEALAPRLADVPHRLFALTLDLGQGARVGVLRLAVPQGVETPGAAAAPDRCPDWQDRLSGAVLRGAVTLDARLPGLRLSVADLAALAPGAVLPLEPEALTQARLVVRGHEVARARLGQAQGFRALRLSLAADPSDAPGDPAGPIRVPSAAQSGNCRS